MPEHGAHRRRARRVPLANVHVPVGKDAKELREVLDAAHVPVARVAHETRDLRSLIPEKAQRSLVLRGPRPELVPGFEDLASFLGVGALVLLRSVEHKVHRCQLGGVPGQEVLVEGGRVLEHHARGGDLGRIPLADIRVERRRAPEPTGRRVARRGARRNEFATL